MNVRLDRCEYLLTLFWGQAMSSTQKAKGVGRRRETARKKTGHDIAGVLEAVGATLAAARVRSLRPGAAESLACLLEAWQHEHPGAGPTVPELGGPGGASARGATAGARGPRSRP